MEYNSDFFNFIEKNRNEDPGKMRLKYHGKDMGFDIDFAATQIECRRKFRNKFRDFLSCSSILFPSCLAGEQATHQAVAKFHASLVSHQDKILDMTAGLGIDALAMAENGAKVFAIEKDLLKAEILKYNATQIGLSLEVINDDSVKFLQETKDFFDIIFIDPARRNEKGSKVFLLEECQPDILKFMDLLLLKANRILIKVSPMLDVSSILKKLNVAVISAVSMSGECKELLIQLDNKRETKEIKLQAINLNKDGEIISDFQFFHNCNPLEILDFNYLSNLTDLQNSYLYEPNASIMKFAPWNELHLNYPELIKIAPSSHLFVSKEFYHDFPGRKMKIEKIIDKKDLKSLLNKHLNIVSRNYPLSAEKIRKRYKIKEGDEKFLFATTLSNKVGIMILGSKI